MRTFFLLMVMMLILSACAAPSVAQPAPLPAVDVPANPAQTTPPVDKVVDMATQTSAPASPTAEPTTEAKPAQVTPTSPAVALPKTLTELNIPATTYTDAVAGLAFDYPTGWLVNSVPDADKKSAMIYTVSLRSREAKPGPKQQDGVPADMAAIDVTVFNQGGPKTLDQAINERRSQATTSESGQPVKIALEEDWTLANGLQAHRFLYNLGPEMVGGSGPDRMSSELVTMIHGRMVLVTGMGDLSLFDTVAASMREK